MIEGRASSTAKLIAAAHVIAGREESLRGLIAPEAAGLSERLLVAAGARTLLLVARTRLGRRMILSMESKAVPGLILHWLYRKRAIAELVEAARDEGFSQLLVVGAGLDTLPLRLSHESGARRLKRIVCLDHPATQAVVRAALPEAGQSGVLRLVPVDLASQDLGKELRESGVLLPVPTIVIAEGLLMYLEPDRVGSLLRDIAGLDVPRVRVIATAMDAPGGEPLTFRPGSEHVDRWLKRKGEPMKSSIPLGAEAGIFGPAGLSYIKTITPREFVKDARAKLLVGENIIVAER